MKYRFRYLDEHGQQVLVQDLTGLREHIRSGRVDDQTLLYDGLTDEWAPAAAHPAYQLLDDPLARGPEEPAGPEAAGAREPGTSPGTGGPGSEEEGRPGVGFPATDEPAFPEIHMTLAPTGEAESTEEVVKKLLKERERDREDGNVGSRAEGLDRKIQVGAVEESAPATPSAPPSSVPDHPAPPDAPAERAVRPRPRPRRTPPRAPSEGRAPRRAWRRIQVPAWALVGGGLLVLAVGFYGGSRILDASRTAEAAVEPPDSGGAGGTRRTPANPVWAAAEGGAFRDMVDGVDSLRRAHGVERIPGAWLAGPYLAEADSFPEVRDYWERYLAFVDDVRSRDTALFRSSFVGRLQEEDVSGPIVSIRLAQALDVFKESQPARDTVYERMGDLAVAAIDLHDLLVERSDDIEYDPVTEERASRQPILEAWSDDPYLRSTIWTLLDRITANLALLEHDTGSRRSDLTERLFQELRTRSLEGVVGRDGGNGQGS